MVESIIELFTGVIPPWLTVLVISMLPLIGLHGGFVAALLLNVPWEQAIVLAIAGNIIPVPFILIFIRAVLAFMSRNKYLRPISKFLEDKALRKASELVRKYPGRVSIGLFVFVAAPLPGSGAWTGSLISALLGVPFRQSFPMISLGVVGACAIMLILAYAFPYAMGF
ncbi:MAG: small multi-drug export protein [Oscillospiraceae bacterium]|nr:small multi-drug export protein [Oscillospiraceae bacterium]